MIITGPLPARLPALSTVARGGCGFRMPAADLPAAGAASSTVGIEPASLLVLQEDPAPRTRERAARQHCAALLAALGRLQRGLLCGSIEPAMNDLAHLAATPTEVIDDPILASALAMATLRARVEVARFDQARHNRP